ncbi:unnamed protein product [Allacma fusca]|uniref:Uncharacterized protein n=1 Tax=Allacma fusca TaxID=39272 RepID=A0A8J2K2I2_9HEXA|nr:unnamed protein product [Allacma fusca]
MATALFLFFITTIFAVPNFCHQIFMKLSDFTLASDIIVVSTFHNSQMLSYTDSVVLTLYNDTRKVKFINKSGTIRDTLATKHFLPHWSAQILQIGNPDYLNSLLEKFVKFGAPQRDMFVIVSSKSVGGLELQLLSRFKEIYLYNGQNYFKINQNNKILKVQGAPIVPHLTLDSHGVIQGGGKFTIMQTIANHLNYSVQLDSRGRGTGIFKNGTWTGMTGAVYYRQVDLALLTSASVQRYGVVDIVCISPDSILFVAKNPQIQIQWRTIFHPFSLGLWAAFGLSFLSITIVFYLVMRGENCSNISSCIFSPYRIALEQVCDLKLPTLGKFLLSLWIFFILIMGTGYRSDLVAHFSFPVLEETPKDFNELSARKDYRIVFNYLSGTSFNYFQTTKSGAPKSLFRRFELQPASVKCIIAASLNRNTACISWETPMKTRIAGNLSLPGGSKPLVYMSKPLVSFYTGFALQKNSILTDDFYRLVGILRDVGLVTKWDDDVYNNASVLGKEWIRGEKESEVYKGLVMQKLAGEGLRPFGMRNLLGAFIILASGFFITVVEGLIECFPIMNRNRLGKQGKHFRNETSPSTIPNHRTRLLQPAKAAHGRNIRESAREPPEGTVAILITTNLE